TRMITPVPGVIWGIPDESTAKGATMKNLIFALMLVYSGAVLAADNPDWAYPLTPPPPQLDAVTLKSVPGSTKQYTQAQIDDIFNPPDWYPSEHPPMPQIVATGGTRPRTACAQCHLPSGDGHPESANIAGLPANYIVRQLLAFKNGDRKGGRATVMLANSKSLSGNIKRDYKVFGA
ncbi:MAG TPA: hypothetical protein VFN63_00220, partial [Pseudolabrys sp.]|nr:hypothetical protein [Pseudolabrys sp.]